MRTLALIIAITICSTVASAQDRPPTRTCAGPCPQETPRPMVVPNPNPGDPGNPNPPGGGNQALEEAMKKNTEATATNSERIAALTAEIARLRTVAEKKSAVFVHSDSPLSTCSTSSLGSSCPASQGEQFCRSIGYAHGRGVESKYSTQSPVPGNPWPPATITNLHSAVCFD